MGSSLYLPPTLPLQESLHAIWQVERTTLAIEELILPKGIVEIIFDLSERAPRSAQLGGKPYSLSPCFINGFNTAPLQLHLPKQQVFLGMVLSPLAVRKLFGVPAGDFVNQIVDLTLLDKSLHSLWHQLADQAAFEPRVALCCRWLEGKLPQWEPREQRINQFLYGRPSPGVTVPQLAQALCYSPRHLARKMGEATGFNTEELLLYKKYLYALQLVHHTDLSLTEIAYQSHFADQAHFIKTFKGYTHRTPGEYRRQQSSLPAHLYAHQLNTQDAPDHERLPGGEHVR